MQNALVLSRSILDFIEGVAVMGTFQIMLQGAGRRAPKQAAPEAILELGSKISPAGIQKACRGLLCD